MHQNRGGKIGHQRLVELLFVQSPICYTFKTEWPFILAAD